ncbi:MAG: hypothetical protein C0457_18010 [Polymorphum sp.]|nr:hypothetical protein [Polymorphum sp.]
MPSVERNTNMSQRSDFPRSDSFREADAAARHTDDQLGAEDPLVQLARIVNRNRPASSEAGGDYFAALDQDDLLREPAGQPPVSQPAGYGVDESHGAYGQPESYAGQEAYADAGSYADEPYEAYPDQPDYGAPAVALPEDFHLEDPYGTPRSEESGYPEVVSQPFVTPDLRGGGDPLRYEEAEPAQYAPSVESYGLRGSSGLQLDEDAFASSLAAGEGDYYAGESAEDEAVAGLRPGLNLSLDPEELAGYPEDDAAMTGGEVYTSQSYGASAYADEGYADDGAYPAEEAYTEEAYPAEDYAGNLTAAGSRYDAGDQGALRGSLDRGSGFDFAASLEQGLEDELQGAFEAGLQEQGRVQPASSFAGYGEEKPAPSAHGPETGSMAASLSAALAGSLVSALSEEVSPAGAKSAERTFKPRATPQMPQAKAEPSNKAASAPSYGGYDPEALAAAPQPSKAATAAVPFVPDATQPWPSLASDAAVRSAKEASASFAELDDLVGSLFKDERLQRGNEPERKSSGLDSADIDDMAWPDALRNLPREAGPVEDDLSEGEIADIFAQSRPQAQQLPLLYDEDEAPPPPGGYDLDAVARAMQESDPTLAGAGILPPHSAYEEQAAPHSGNSRRGLKIAAAVLGVAVVGGAAFALLGSGGSSVPDGPPQVIAGLEEPLKTYPEPAESGASQPAKLIYDRVGGEPADGERMVVQDSPEPAELPPAPVDGSASDLTPGAPKRVRTLVVRPDGTIINGASSADTAGAGTVRTVSPTPVAQTPALETPGMPGAAGALAPVAALTPAPGAEEAAGPLTPVTPEEQRAADAIFNGATPRVKPGPGAQVAAVQPQPVPAQPSTPQPVNSGPLNLTQPAAPQPVAAQPAQQPQATAPSASSIAPGTYVVQVTSQRSQEQAQTAYAALQRRYPSVLGGQTPVIEPIEIEGRGTFYRVRIPAGSKDAADALCGSLQSAGGDCFVRRN